MDCGASVQAGSADIAVSHRPNRPSKLLAQSVQQTAILIPQARPATRRPPAHGPLLAATRKPPWSVLLPRGGAFFFLFRSQSRAPVPRVSRAGAGFLADGGGGAPSLQCAAEARDLLQAEGWHTCPAWQDVVDGARPPQMRDTGLGDWPHGWQSHAARIGANSQPLLPPRVPRPGLRLGQWSSA